MIAPSPLDRVLETRRPILLVVLFALALFLPGMVTLPPSDRDEARFAQATKQMIETGDWVEIRFGDVARNKKPVGIHWAQAASVTAATALGLAKRTDIWPYRVPSVIGGVLAAVAILVLGRALVGQRVALLAALSLAATLTVTVETHIAKTDAALLAAITAMMLAFARLYLAPAATPARTALVFWSAMGLGVLLKGPVAPTVAGLAALVLYVLDRRAGRPRAWLPALRTSWGLPLALLLVAPWFIAVGIATDGKFFIDAIGGDLGGKLSGADEKHGGPPGFHLALMAVTLFPVGLWVMRALPAIWRDRTDPLTRVLLAWLIPTWLIFEILPTKLPHYVMVAFPPLLLLASRWLLDTSRASPPRWLSGLSVALWLIAAIALGVLGEAITRLAGEDRPWGVVLAAAAAIAMIGLTIQALRHADLKRAGFVGLAFAPLLTGAILHGVLPVIEMPWLAPRIVAAADTAWAAKGGRPPAGERPFATAGFHEPSLVFLGGTDIRLLQNGEDAARHLVDRPCGLVVVRDRYEASFLAEAARLRLAVSERGIVNGFNYSRGERISLILFGRASGCG